MRSLKVPLAALALFFVLAFVVLLPRLASAATVAPAPAFLSLANLGTLLDSLHAVAWVISLLGLLIVGIPKGFAWVDAHTKIKQSALADAIKGRLIGIVEMFVTGATQVSVDTLKADYAAGKVTSAQYKAELQRIKVVVIAKAAAQVRAEGIGGLVEKLLGVGTGGVTLESMISDAIEFVLGRLKLKVPAAVVQAVATGAAGLAEKMLPASAVAPVAVKA